MPSFSASAVVIEEGQVLLIQRKDFEVWGLPGGGIDPEETVAETAIREVREETGIDISLTRLVGIYSCPRWHGGGDHVIVFAARPNTNTNTITLQPTEIIDAGYFLPSDLPEPLIGWHRKRILDAIGDRKGLVSVQDLIWPFDDNMRLHETYMLLDESGLSRQDFYRKHFTKVGEDGEKDIVE